MYPIKFDKMYYERIWGSNEGFESFRNDVPKDKVIGESWDISCHKNGMGTVVNGKLKGKSFDEIIDIYKEKIIGTKINTKDFPLLIKIIASNDKLSVQVHPDDDYANRVEKDSGKTESWYVIDAKENAELIVGTKNCTKEIFKKAIEEGNLDKYLNRVKVKKGDFFFVQSGLVHAICEGVIIAEIQQSSDTTYRVYDYNRGREIHVDKALDVIDFSLSSKKIQGTIKKEKGFDKTILCSSKYFSVEKYDIKDNVIEQSDEERFYLFTCVEGNGNIEYDGGKEKICIGDSLLIPAALGKYKISGKMVLLKSYVTSVKNN